MAIPRREMVAAILIVAGFILILVVLYTSLRPAEPTVGFDNNFFVQQRIRIQNQNQNK